MNDLNDSRQPELNSARSRFTLNQSTLIVLMGLFATLGACSGEDFENGQLIYIDGASGRDGAEGDDHNSAPGGNEDPPRAECLTFNRQFDDWEDVTCAQVPYGDDRDDDPAHEIQCRCDSPHQDDWQHILTCAPEVTCASELWEVEGSWMTPDSDEFTCLFEGLMDRRPGTYEYAVNYSHSQGGDGVRFVIVVHEDGSISHARNGSGGGEAYGGRSLSYDLYSRPSHCAPKSDETPWRRYFERCLDAHRTAGLPGSNSAEILQCARIDQLFEYDGSRWFEGCEPTEFSCPNEAME